MPGKKKDEKSDSTKLLWLVRNRIRHFKPVRGSAQVGLLLMVRIVEFYRKRMQQRKAVTDARSA